MIQTEELHIQARNDIWLKQKYNMIIKSGKKNWSLVCANVKEFRQLCTLYGKEAGDRMLMDLYTCLESFVGDRGYVAHSYADNFTILLSMGAEDVDYNFFHPFVDVVFEIDNPQLFHNIYMSFGVIQLDNPDLDYYQAQAYANIGRIQAPTIRNRSFCSEVLAKNIMILL